MVLLVLESHAGDSLLDHVGVHDHAGLDILDILLGCAAAVSDLAGDIVLAEAILVSVSGNRIVDAGEALAHSGLDRCEAVEIIGVLGVETVAQPVANAIELAFYGREVGLQGIAGLDIGYSVAAPAVASPAEEGEENDDDPPTAIAAPAVTVVAGYCGDVREGRSIFKHSSAFL